LGIEAGQDEDCSLFLLMLERLLREDGDANLGHGWIMQQKNLGVGGEGSQELMMTQMT
jgi:hypothetical protein